MESGERAIREVHTTWIDAVNAGDVVTLLTLLIDDVVFLNSALIALIGVHVHVNVRSSCLYGVCVLGA